MGGGGGQGSMEQPQHPVFVLSAVGPQSVIQLGRLDLGLGFRLMTDLACLHFLPKNTVERGWEICLIHRIKKGS
jgi:hypothetical protein